MQALIRRPFRRRFGVPCPDFGPAFFAIFAPHVRTLTNPWGPKSPDPVRTPGWAPWALFRGPGVAHVRSLRANVQRQFPRTAVAMRYVLVAPCSVTADRTYRVEWGMPPALAEVEGEVFVQFPHANALN